MKPVIQKALVRLDVLTFKAFAAQRERWAVKQAMFIRSYQYLVCRSLR